METSMNSALASMDLTSAQGHIMGYLARRPQPPCSRDIEETFHLSHPTVSGLLSRLEKKGFIELRPDSADRRCKRVNLTPKAEECQKEIAQHIQSLERTMMRGMTQEEAESFMRLLELAYENLNTEMKKEESSV